MKSRRIDHVNAWLATRRFQEPPIKRSVDIWLVQEATRLAQRVIAEAPLDELTARAVKAYAKKKQQQKLKEPRLKTDRRKQSMYFTVEVLAEIRAEATRMDRDLSWVVQQAWKLAVERVKQFPTAHREGIAS